MNNHVIYFKRNNNRKYETVKFFLIQSQFFISVIIFNLIYYITVKPVFDTAFYYSELFIFIVLGLNLLRKRNRVINDLTFNDDINKLTISYIHFIFASKIIISYEHLQYYYNNKIYERFNTPKTLEFHHNKCFIAEIRHNDYFGWADDTIFNIIEKLKTIKNERNNKV